MKQRTERQFFNFDPASLTSSGSHQKADSVGGTSANNYAQFGHMTRSSLPPNSKYSSQLMTSGVTGVGLQEMRTGNEQGVPSNQRSQSFNVKTNSVGMGVSYPN